MPMLVLRRLAISRSGPLYWTRAIPTPILLLVWLACGRSVSQRAIAAFEVAIRFNPSFAAAHVLLAQMYLYAGRREEAIRRAEKGIRLSPSDPRLFIWLPALAGAHYQMRHYWEAVEAGRRSWSLNRNWPHGLRYVVAGLGQMGRIEDARAALAELKLMDANQEASARVLRRNGSDPADVDHLLEGLRKAGFE